VSETKVVDVVSGACEVTWQLSTELRGRDWAIVLTSPTTSWTSTGSDPFEALRALRRQLDNEGIRVGLAGALPNAWASGMQRDMGEGRSVYLLEIPRSAGRPPTAGTLDAVSCDRVGSVADQDEFQRRWRASGV
jgi:hypothetical protein